jgi:MFS family permease
MNKSVGYLDLVRANVNFRNLWAGQVVSLLGDWFNLIASASLIASLTHSGLAVGGLFVIRMLAPFLVSPIAGVFTDRYNRKQLLIWTDISRAVVVLGFLLVREPEHVWLLYTLTAVQLGISGFFYPARSAILPDVVSADELGAANALSSATWSIMLSFGAALGGLIAGQWGIYPAFVIDAFTFLISALFITRLQLEKTTFREEVTRTVCDGLQEYYNGLRYLVENRDVLVVSLLKAANTMATGAFQIVQVYMAEQLYIIGTGSSLSLGLLYAFVGAGTGFGPIWVRKITRDENQAMRIAIGLSYLFVAIGLAITAPLPAFWIVLIGTFIRGLGGGVNWVFSTQVLLQTVPNKVMGRVFSTEFAAMTLAGAFTAYLGGWGMDQPNLGIQGLIWWMVGISLIFGIFWGLWILYIGKIYKKDSVKENGDNQVEKEI